jgi:phosphoserine aminotransferase
MNFSGGPGALPASVLEQTERAIREVDGVGLSILGISHRSRWFREVVESAEANIRGLLQCGADYRVLFLQGGGSLQFSMIPMTLLTNGRQADYVDTGYWSHKSIAEARRQGRIRVAWSGEATGYRSVPRASDVAGDPDAAYLHYVSNETVEGVQFHEVIGRDDVLRVCDMSSDFLSRPFDVRQYGLIYAHAQKNLGPAGVTVVLIREDMFERVPEGLPAMLDYRVHAANGSIYNTPPVFAIYVMLLVTEWLRDEIGGLAAMDAINREKARRIYGAVDASDGFYRPHAERRDRSLMNAVFRLPTPELDRRFVADAEAEGLYGLEGHRSLGGVRASLYNAVTLGAVDALCAFMDAFRRQHDTCGA